MNHDINLEFTHYKPHFRITYLAQSLTRLERVIVTQATQVRDHMILIVAQPKA